jgi:hypothetical protein
MNRHIVSLPFRRCILERLMKDLGGNKFTRFVNFAVETRCSAFNFKLERLYLYSGQELAA